MNDGGEYNGTACSPHLLCTSQAADPWLAVGEIEVRVNGETAINVTGLMLRPFEESTIQGLHFDTFFGGEFAAFVPTNSLTLECSVSRPYTGLGMSEGPIRMVFRCLWSHHSLRLDTNIFNGLSFALPRSLYGTQQEPKLTRTAFMWI